VLHAARSVFLNSTDNTTRLLSLDSPTPRARTYADRLSKNSREVTLVAALGLFRRLAVGRSEAQDPEAEFGHLQGAQLSRAHVATPIEPDGPSALGGAGRVV
jgi:hypothetical protein